MSEFEDRYGNIVRPGSPGIHRMGGLTAQQLRAQERLAESETENECEDEENE